MEYLFCHAHCFFFFFFHYTSILAISRARIDYGFDDSARDFGFALSFCARIGKLILQHASGTASATRELVCPVTFHSRVHFARIFFFFFFLILLSVNARGYGRDANRSFLFFFLQSLDTLEAVDKKSRNAPLICRARVIFKIIVNFFSQNSEMCE